jgi:hypothetical protein
MTRTAKIPLSFTLADGSTGRLEVDRTAAPARLYAVMEDADVPNETAIHFEQDSAGKWVVDHGQRNGTLYGSLGEALGDVWLPEVAAMFTALAQSAGVGEVAA